MIEVKDLVKQFDDNVVLDHVNATFRKGAVNIIIGKSGSGKTVFLKNLIGLMKPTSGEIRYGGRNFLKMKSGELKRLRKDMGMLFQGSALFDSRTVLENVMFPLDMFSKKNLRERRKRAEFCLERVNLEKAHDLYPSEISGGMMKRVAIARAIALNPKYLFCDEPNSGLDPKTAKLIDELISDITKDFNITSVVVTHDMNSVMNIGDYIFFLHKGKKEWEGSRDDILDAENKELNDFVFASNIFKKVKEAEDIIEENNQEQLEKDKQAQEKKDKVKAKQSK